MPGRAKLELQVGEVGSAWASGNLAFSIVVDDTGIAHVQIYANDPTDRRKSGVLLMLGWTEWTQLWQVMNEMHATLERMSAARQFVGLGLPK
jgi:hypothetical protein